MPSPSSQPGLLSLFATYLGDGVVSLLLPVTTIRTASERNLTYGQIAGIALAFAILAGLVLVLPYLAYRGLAPASDGAGNAPGILQGFDTQTSPFPSALDLLPLARVLVSSVILFLIVKLLMGPATFRDFMSAALVLVGVWFVGHLATVFFATLRLLVAGADSPAGAALTIAGFITPVITGLVLLSFSVLVVRFGGRVDFLRAFGAVAVLIVLLALKDYMTGEGAAGLLMSYDLQRVATHG